MNFVDLRLRPILKKRGMKEGKADKLSRAVALVFAFIFAAFIVYAFFAMLLPQLYEKRHEHRQQRAGILPEP